MIFGKNAEVQAAQEKLESIRLAIHKETERLLLEQRTRLNTVSHELEKGITQQNIVLTELTQTVSNTKCEYSSLQSYIVEATNTLELVKKDITDAKQEYSSLKQSSTQENERILHLKDQKSQLEIAVSTLKTESIAETSVLSKLKDTKDILESKIADLEVEYDKKAAEKEEKQAILNTKLLISRQELEQHQQQDTVVRDELAKWQKRLEERDTNLRVRERKVEDSETKLIHNANLLEL